MRTLIEVRTTTGSQEEAGRIARALVERGLVACVHIQPVSSVYRWQGQLCEEGEWRLAAKTLSGRFGQVRQAITELHTYELPAIWATEVTEASESYAQWVRDCVP